MPLITIPREMGSLGKDDAAQVAQQFGAKPCLDFIRGKGRIDKKPVIIFNIERVIFMEELAMPGVVKTAAAPQTRAVPH